MNAGERVLGNKEKKKSLWFKGREEFMEEVSSLASKDQLDSNGEKKEDGFFRYEEMRVCTMYFCYIHESHYLRGFVHVIGVKVR